MSVSPGSASPAWGPTLKLVIALTIVAIAAGLFIQFHGIIAPLLMAFVVAYLLHPVAEFLRGRLHLAWRLSVSLIYVVLLIILVGMLTWGGVGLVQQIQSLISIVQANLSSLPGFIQNLSGQVYQLGPLQIDFRHLDLAQLSSQLLGIVQPLLGGTGTLLASVAASAATFLGWALFILLISYFMLAESGGFRSQLVRLDLPGYSEDFRRIGLELGHIWNAFLRGQIIVFLLTIAAYTIVLGVLGVHYALGIAMLAGLARFLPYVGPWITWITLAMVTYFQGSNIFGLSQTAYAVLCVGMGLLMDQIMDNLVSPRIIAQALRVHPAAVLIAALIALRVLGLVGVVVAAPILATVALIWNYTMRKMLDLDPWPEAAPAPPPPVRPAGIWTSLRKFWRERIRRTT